MAKKPQKSTQNRPYLSLQFWENGRLAQAYMRPLYGLYMAFIRPIGAVQK